MRNQARWDEAIDTPFVDEVIDGYGGRPEALIAIFGAVQTRYGYLPERALRRISDRMSIHWAQVFGAAGLGGFRLLPAAGHVVTVCTCAACRFAGGDRLLEAISDELGIEPGATTADGKLTLETGADVGAGAIAPAIRIDTLVYGPLTPETARSLAHQRRHTSETEAATSGSRA
jgi:NADH-quinone oxidoreductase subunit E